MQALSQEKDGGTAEEKMIVFEFSTDGGDTRDIFWLGCTSVTSKDKEESDGIYEQIAAHEAHLDD
jgi:hypothetical protein